MPSSPERGSLWRKWDLHIHTPVSILNNQFPAPNGMLDWEAYVLALENSGMAVVGVTDYFTIDGYRKLLEFKAAGRLAGITLLPNVEFRIDQVIVPGEGKPGRRLNLHVLFSDELSPDLIEEHFLHDLHFTAEGRPQEPMQQRKLKRSNLLALGEDLQSEHARFREQSALEVGATQAVVSLKEISETLASDDRFRGKYLVVLADIYTSDISWDGQDHNVRKVILQASDFMFSSNPKTRAWCLGQPPYAEGAQRFVEEFQSLKACIHGSDAHDLASIGKPCILRGQQGHDCASEQCEMRYCWIKADPTFEGLRQLLYEPEARVRCQADDPSPVQSPQSISGFVVHGLQLSPELTLAQSELHFNPQLIAVVGGRGGGKTALVDLIANCYVDRIDCDDLNSFVKRIADADPALKVTLSLANGDTFSKTVTDGSVREDSELVYIAQGELEAHVTDATALTAQIDSMILKSAAVTDTVKRYELDQAASLIDELTRLLASRNRDVVKLEGATAQSLKAEVEVAVKKKKTDIEEVGKRIEAARGRLSPERAAEAEAQQKELATLRDTAQKQARLKELLGSADEVIRQYTDDMGSVVDEINEQLKQLSKKDALPPFRYGGAAKLETLKSDLKAESAATAASIEQRSKALTSLASEQESLARALDQKKKAEGELEALNEQLAVVTRAEQQLATARTARTKTLKNLVLAILDRRMQYKEVIALFAENKDRLLSDLTFSAEVAVDTDELLGRAEELLDGRTARIRANGQGAGDLDCYVDLARGLFLTDTPDVDAFVAEATVLLDRLRPKMKEKRAKNPSELHELVFANYFTFKPSVLYKRLPLSKLSLGQKATVLIKIHLADGTRPIILDSHDDHLDNEFIMDELVEGIRQAKTYRQVILVSNNGNVVVNSDAEQVIIAERADTAITYQTGSLENPGMRDRLINVLEGGRAAFSQRGKKYRL